MSESYTSSEELQSFALWDRMKAKRSVVSFDLEITARCPNDCRHCYINLPAGDRAAKKNELTLDEIGHIADQAVELGALWCLITGGEPLLRQDFTDIYMLLKRKGLLVSVFTTATLINSKHIELFRKYPPRDLEVTVYGVTAETYERVTRRPGSFAAFMRGLDLLRHSGIKVRLKAMALRSNIHELGDIARFARDRTKDYFRFDPHLHLRYDRSSSRNEEIRRERLSPGEVVAIEQADPERMEAFRENCELLTSTPSPPAGSYNLFRCAAGNSRFTVGYEGTFRICSSLLAPGTTCDLRQVSLKDAWLNQAPRVRSMQSSRQSFLETCHVCPLAELCYWCPAVAYLECGEMDGGASYYCDVAHARADMIRAQG